MTQKQKQKDKPDLVVWDEERGYYQRELTYGSNHGAPAIKLEDVSGWKLRGAVRVNHHFKSRYEEIKAEAQKLIDEYNWNELVYTAQFNFQPVMGETYHLYMRDDESVFLSLIPPNAWKQKYIASFELDSREKWVKINFEHEL
jgi:hypothetical protein